jgi:hypothetical protein
MYSVGIAFSPHSGNDAYSFLSLTICTGVVSGLDYRTEPIISPQTNVSLLLSKGLVLKMAPLREFITTRFFTVLSEMHNLGGSLNNQK